MIAVINCGLGNIGSIVNMLKRVEVDASEVSIPEELALASGIILPGVGAFDEGMTNLQEHRWVAPLAEAVLSQGKPLLGICLGMQLLSDGSDEGQKPGLGWIPGRTVRFKPEAGSELRVPHMGWNTVQPRSRNSLFQGLDDDHGFYFVHSYHVTCAEPEDILATTHHGIEFVSAVKRGNIMGVQFHPEKSHKHGMDLFRQFAKLTLPC